MQARINGQFVYSSGWHCTAMIWRGEGMRGKHGVCSVYEVLYAQYIYKSYSQYMTYCIIDCAWFIFSEQSGHTYHTKHTYNNFYTLYLIPHHYTTLKHILYTYIYVYTGFYKGFSANLVRGVGGALLLVGYDEGKVRIMTLHRMCVSIHVYMHSCEKYKCVFSIL